MRRFAFAFSSSLVVSFLLAAPLAHAQTDPLFPPPPPTGGPDAPPPATPNEPASPLAPAPTPEPPAAPFGAAGQFVLNGAASAWLSYVNFDNSPATRFSVGFSPSFDYFVLR